MFYTGTLDDGTEFDSNVGGTPLTFVIGGGRVIPGFDAAVRGMTPGQSITVHIPVEDAYGERRDDLIIGMPVEGAPEDLEVGDTVTLQGGIQVIVLEIGTETILVDANHSLAGKPLDFTIELVSINR